jgi:Ulp1 family protease
MQIKKILGILLAVCFLMSVTAAAVSAAPGPDDNKGKPYNNPGKPIINNPGKPVNNQINHVNYPGKPVNNQINHVNYPGKPVNNQFNKNGFDNRGYNNRGFNKFGYNKNGFDKFGYNKKGFDKFNHKKGYHSKGHWMFKKTKHNKDQKHKSFWYTNDKYWHWDN